MKTIMIVIGGLSVLRDEGGKEKTPLMEAEVPSLDNMAKVGCGGMVSNVPEGAVATPVNAMLGLLGYDFNRGVPDQFLLESIGIGRRYGGEGVPWFVIPKFSGHGIVLTDSAAIRGAGMLGLLRPAFTVRPEDDPEASPTCGTLGDKAQAAIQAIDMFDFVLIYVDGPARHSLSGNREGQVEALEEIDRELITPVADYVWNAKLQMSLVVTGDLPVDLTTGHYGHGEVPAVVYFNDDAPYDTERFDEESLDGGPLNAPLVGDLIRQLVSFEPYVEK